jgi:hypothetical protein
MNMINEIEQKLMGMPGTLPKFTDEDGNPNVYDQRFETGTTTGPNRLLIAPIGSQIKLITDLMSLMPGPFGIVYVLVVGRGYESGRYQLGAELSFEEAKSFLMDYRSFFEQDGRATLLIASHSDRAMLVYDRHNVIYAYGPLEEYTNLIRQQGFGEGDVRYPVPHIHHYHAEFDAEETRLMTCNTWLKSPLRDSDSD